MSTTRESRIPGMGYTTIAVLTLSLIPLAIGISDAEKSPFLFNALFRTGISISCLLILLTFFRGGLSNEGGFAPSIHSTFRALFRSVILWPSNLFFAFGVAGSLNYALLAWSVKYLDIAVAAVLYEVFPAFVLIATAVFLLQGLRIRIIDLTTPLVGLLILGGGVFVISSQKTGLTVLESGLSSGEIRGVALMIAAIIAAVLSMISSRWVSDLTTLASPEVDKRSDRLFFIVISILVINIVSIVLNFGIGAINDEQLSLHSTPLPLAFGLLAGCGLVAVQASIFMKEDLFISSINFMVPIYSLLWVVYFSQTNIVRGDFLIIGVSAIVIANLFLRFQSEIRMAFNWFLFALWAGGMIVYLREDIFELSAVEKWHWTTGGYFEALALSATVFTLLLAFRVSRLISRAGDEDIRVFSSFRKLDILVQRDVINRRILKCVLQIDSPASRADLIEAYMEARCYISEARRNVKSMEDIDLQFLSEVEANLDALARSKQQDITPGEMFALFIFGAITVSLALLSRPPEAEGWNRFLVDIFAVLISAVIVFLVVNVWDLRSERDEGKLNGLHEQTHVVQFFDTTLQSFDQRLSIVVASAVTIIYIVLIVNRWVGGFPWLV